MLFPFKNQALGSPGHLNESVQHPCFCELPEQDQRQAGRSRWPGGETDSKALGQHLNIYSRSWRVTAWARTNTTVKIMVAKTPPHDWKQMPGRDSHTTQSPENIIADFTFFKTLKLAPYKWMMTTPSSWQESIHGESTLSLTESLFYPECGMCMVCLHVISKKVSGKTIIFE